VHTRSVNWYQEEEKKKEEKEKTHDRACTLLDNCCIVMPRASIYVHEEIIVVPSAY